MTVTLTRLHARRGRLVREPSRSFASPEAAQIAVRDEVEAVLDRSPSLAWDYLGLAWDRPGPGRWRSSPLPDGDRYIIHRSSH